MSASYLGIGWGKVGRDDRFARADFIKEFVGGYGREDEGNEGKYGYIE
jgi:hypothetical protein